MSAALAAAGVELGSAPADVVVVATRTTKAPEAPSAGAWVWVSDGPIGTIAAHDAARRGAYDAVDLQRADAATRLIARLAELDVVDPPPPSADEFVGESAAARRVLGQLARAARTSMPVLLTGETGTGKDVAARLLHAWSKRQRKRLVAINCAAIPNELIEAELFGYTRGAFSGAVRQYDGQLMAAEGGTVFLDEIDETPPTLQAKLLRVLEDRVVSRIGENEWHQVDFRLVAATNRELERLVARGEFGADLYERLAIVTIALPTLRERLGDLPMLVRHFVARFYAEEPDARARHDVRAVDEGTLAALAAYPWPGNIRELRNVVFEALVQKRAGGVLLLGDLPRRVLETRTLARDEGIVDREAIARKVAAGTMNLRKAIEELERMALEEALAHAGGSPARAARLLGEVGRGSARDPGGTVRAMMRRLTP